MDKRKNRYMINFIDHKSNYVRVFVAKSKDEAARKFQHFMVFFEILFNVRVHMLRTDGGVEYRNLDLFCQQTGIGRQITERNTSASNRKAEIIHRTVMNTVRCMLFGCGLPLGFWGYAAEYVAYVLNRMPTRANLGRKSPMSCSQRIQRVSRKWWCSVRLARCTRTQQTHSWESVERQRSLSAKPRKPRGTRC